MAEGQGGALLGTCRSSKRQDSSERRALVGTLACRPPPAAQGGLVLPGGVGACWGPLGKPRPARSLGAALLTVPPEEGRGHPASGGWHTCPPAAHLPGKAAAAAGSVVATPSGLWGEEEEPLKALGRLTCDCPSPAHHCPRGPWAPAPLPALGGWSPEAWGPAPWPSAPEPHRLHLDVPSGGGAHCCLHGAPTMQALGEPPGQSRGPRGRQLTC